MKPDLRVQWQLFAGSALFVAVIDVVYWFASYEQAGTVLLGLAAALSALCAGWLWLQDRRRGTATAPAADGERAGELATEAAPYLPSSSVWPLAVGVAAALTVNGFVLGWPFAVPGGLFLALAVAGFVGEGRRRA